MPGLVASPGTGLLISALSPQTPDQIITGGANVVAHALGTFSSGTLTVDCGLCPMQTLTNNGAFTIAAPANGGYCLIKITNGASAGTITFSGFAGGNTGDPLDTTNGHVFWINVLTDGVTAIYMVRACQ